MNSQNNHLEILKKEILERYPPILNKKDVCDILDISSATLNRLISKSNIGYFKMGGANSSVRFKVTDVIRFIEQNSVTAYHQGEKYENHN